MQRVNIQQPLQGHDRRPWVPPVHPSIGLVEQQPDHRGVQLGAAGADPVVEAVLGQQIAGVEGERTLGVPAAGRRLQRLEVDPERLGGQAEQVVAQT